MTLAAASLPATVTVELLHALVAHVAGQTHTRALIIKGPTAARQRLRSERISGDVDVLIEPGGADAFVTAFLRRGWSERDSLSENSAEHSRTITHERWGTQLDVHLFYPGIFAGAEEAFETLWRRRDHQRFAGKDVPVADRVSNAVVLALHALRTPNRSSAELDAIAARLPESGTEIAHLALTLRCRTVLSPLLDRLGLGPFDKDLTPEEWESWTQLTSPYSGTFRWMDNIRTARWPRKLSMIWLAIWLTDTEMKAQLDAAGQSDRTLLGARLRRLGRGLASLPAVLRLSAHRPRSEPNTHVYRQDPSPH